MRLSLACKQTAASGILKRTEAQRAATARKVTAGAERPMAVSWSDGRLEGLLASSTFCYDLSVDWASEDLDEVTFRYVRSMQLVILCLCMSCRRQKRIRSYYYLD